MDENTLIATDPIMTTAHAQRTTVTDNAVEHDELKPLSAKRAYWMVGLYAVVGLAALIMAWHYRDHFLIQAKEGIGYALGIIGSIAILVVAFHTLARAPTPVTGPSMHLGILLSIAGPVMMMVHTNYQWGSRTGTMAMGAVVLLWLSTLLGRHLRSRLQSTQDGNLTTQQQLEARFIDAKAGMTEAIRVSPALKTYLAQFEEEELSNGRWLLAKYLKVRGLSIRLEVVRQRAMKFLRQVLESRTLEEDWNPDQLQAQLRKSSASLAAYLASLSSIAEHRVYARFVSIWKIVQIAILVIFGITLAMHVYSVHAY